MKRLWSCVLILSWHLNLCFIRPSSAITTSCSFTPPTSLSYVLKALYIRRYQDIWLCTLPVTSARIYPLTSLNNIHLSSVKHVSNKVSQCKFSNTSDLETAVPNVLPGYLHPCVHYPSLLIPIIIILIIIIPLCCWVRKALTMYNVLRDRRRVRAKIRDQESQM